MIQIAYQGLREQWPLPSTNSGFSSGFLGVFDKLVTTPNVLTAVSNLSGQLPENLRAPFYSDFANRIALLEEHYVPSVGASSLAHFNKFGLTDSGIVQLVKDKFLVLTRRSEA